MRTKGCIDGINHPSLSVWRCESILYETDRFLSSYDIVAAMGSGNYKEGGGFTFFLTQCAPTSHLYCWPSNFLVRVSELSSFHTATHNPFRPSKTYFLSCLACLTFWSIQSNIHHYHLVFWMSRASGATFNSRYLSVPPVFWGGGGGCWCPSPLHCLMSTTLVSAL